MNTVKFCTIVFVIMASSVLATAAISRPETTWVTTFDHDFYNWADAHIDTFIFPPDSLPWDQILLYYQIQCPGDPGDCDPWDRLGHVRVIEYDGDVETHYEIARIVTPYDITGGSRPDSCIWELDVSDYESVLHDSVTLRSQIYSWIGDQRGWIVTITFAFISGASAFEPYHIENLWTHDYLVYGDPDNPIDDYLQPVTLELPYDMAAAKIRAITTGHGQGNTDNAAEFSYKWHEVVANDDRFTHYLWRNDCNLNDCSPQGGTWQYSRAGWCPGDRVIPWEVDVSESVDPGDTVVFDYDIQPYINECRPTNPNCVDGITCNDCDYNYTGHTEPHYVLNTQLILYRERLIPLSAEVVEGELRLHWQEWPRAAQFWVYGAPNDPYFETSWVAPYHNRLAVLNSDSTSWSSENGIGDPDINWTYQVIAVDVFYQLLHRTNRIGEQDYEGYSENLRP